MSNVTVNFAESVTLATEVLAACKLYEESFDKEKAARMQEDAAAGKLANFAECYTMTLMQACTPAGSLAMPVYLLLTGTWNDTLDWANTIVNAVKTPNNGE